MTNTGTDQGRAGGRPFPRSLRLPFPGPLVGSTSPERSRRIVTPTRWVPDTPAMQKWLSSRATCWASAGVVAVIMTPPSQKPSASGVGAKYPGRGCSPSDPTCQPVPVSLFSLSRMLVIHQLGSIGAYFRGSTPHLIVVGRLYTPF